MSAFGLGVFVGRILVFIFVAIIVYLIIRALSGKNKSKKKFGDRLRDFLEKDIRTS